MVEKQTKSDRIAGQEENMSDYRRLISYMYEYEGKEKGKNVGFVKLETKNGQCRLNLSIKKVYTGGNAAGVYLLGKRVKETFLGNIFIRGGNGDFHAIIDSNNVEGGGNDLKDYYGLTVHDVKNSWRSYTTIWEDAAFPEKNDLAGQTQAYEILPGGRKPDPLKAASRAVMELDRELEQECTLRAAAQSIAPEPPQSEAAPPPGIETAPEREPAAVTDQPPQAASPSGSKQPLPEAPLLPATETAPKQEPAAVTEQPLQAASPSGSKQPLSEATPPPATETEPKQEPAAVIEQPPQAASPSGPNQPPQSEAPQLLGTEIVPEREPAAATEQPQSETTPPPASEQPLQTTQPYPSPELEDPEVLRYLQDTEDIAANPEKLWQELRSSYPKIQPFEYESGCEILTIRPQDIGRLPRESWVYGNNSFLLHGYYNFRYIILFRLGDKNGRFRYMIGVPGHYYSSEKYMASMFGFPNFVLSKKQPPNDGRFGYWYTDIKLR